MPTRALVLAAFALALGGCGGGGDDGGEAAPDGGATAPATSEDGGGDGATTSQGNAKLGVLIWHEQGCGNCHVLADAGISAAGRAGVVGPDLDEAMPSYDLVVERVTNGKGEMPSFSDQLLPSDIQNVAAYVSSVTGK